MKKEIIIEGMMCAHCSGRVKQALEALEGVSFADVSHEKGNAVVTFSKEVSDKAISEAVSGQGYTVKEIKNI